MYGGVRDGCALTRMWCGATGEPAQRSWSTPGSAHHRALGLPRLVEPARAAACPRPRDGGGPHPPLWRERPQQPVSWGSLPLRSVRLFWRPFCRWWKRHRCSATVAPETNAKASPNPPLPSRMTSGHPVSGWRPRSHRRWTSTSHS